MAGTDPIVQLAERYALVAEIGHGGTARVLLARDVSTGERCAIKILLPRYAARADLRRRFYAEARAMASISHPNVLRVYGWGVCELGPWLATEYADGGSVANWVRRHGPMPAELVARVAREVCAGVIAAHDKGIVHRDLKPDNVLVTASGACRVADFGLAQVGWAERVTATGARIGTVGFVAPEQLEDARRVDARADVYSLAATIWWLSTGRVPAHAFQADPYASGVPGPLCPVVARGTAYAPEERYATVRELLAELEAAAARLPPLRKETPALVDRRGDGEIPTWGSLEPTDETEPTWIDDDR